MTRTVPSAPPPLLPPAQRPAVMRSQREEARVFLEPAMKRSSSLASSSALSKSATGARSTECRPTACVVERRSESTGRVFRFTQKELPIIGGNRMITTIEVVVNNEVIFSVKHNHPNMWKRQLSVHKNLLLACILVDIPCPLEVPEDSVRTFHMTENPAHIHFYLDRILPHFNTKNLPSEVSAFWWRAVGFGSLVIQNWKTGRSLFLPNKGKLLTDAADTLRRFLDLLQDFPQSFWILDPSYAKIDEAATQEASSRVENTGATGSDVEKAALTIQSWALEDNVSPWMTKLVVKSIGHRLSQVTNFRYSLGVELKSFSEADTTPSSVVISLQVHSNEPLSRELKAYPVCMTSIQLDSLEFKDMTMTYLRSLWFLRKLFEFHEGSETRRKGRVNRDRRSAPASPSNLEFCLRSNDETKDITMPLKLTGGARLAPKQLYGRRLCVTRF